MSAGSGSGSHTRAKRERITGWSAAAVRRHTKWLYSVDIGGLSGRGWAVTLTMRECPDTAEDWTRLRKAWLERVRRLGASRVHWVVEWQRRGVPHLHCAVYFPEDSKYRGAHVVREWQEVAARYGVGARSQYVAEISGPEGWLKYLSKHASRGVAHYQRQGKPAGWESTGRLWGYGGAWPVEVPIEVPIDARSFYRMRRLARAWRVADARAAGLRGEGWSRLTYARRMLRDPVEGRSRFRGVSEWIPESVALRLLEVVGAQDSVGAEGPAASEASGTAATAEHASDVLARA